MRRPTLFVAERCYSVFFWRVTALPEKASGTAGNDAALPAAALPTDVEPLVRKDVGGTGLSCGFQMQKSYMQKSYMIACGLAVALALAGCSGPKGDKGDKGQKGEQGDAGPTGPAGPQGPQGPAGKNGENGVSPPAQFRVVRASPDGVVSRPALCGTDEVMVSATCLSKTGAVNQYPKTLSDTGAACDPRPGESEIPDVVILCEKRQQ
jgi:hypothetical protein